MADDGKGHGYFLLFLLLVIPYVLQLDVCASMWYISWTVCETTGFTDSISGGTDNENHSGTVVDYSNSNGTGLYNHSSDGTSLSSHSYNGTGFNHSSSNDTVPQHHRSSISHIDKKCIPETKYLPGSLTGLLLASALLYAVVKVVVSSAACCLPCGKDPQCFAFIVGVAIPYLTAGILSLIGCVHMVVMEVPWEIIEDIYDYTLASGLISWFNVTWTCLVVCAVAPNLAQDCVKLCQCPKKKSKTPKASRTRSITEPADVVIHVTDSLLPNLTDANTLTTTTAAANGHTGSDSRTV